MKPNLTSNNFFKKKGGVTYTPRLLLCDLKGTLKHHPKDGELNGECSSSIKEVDSVLWDPECYEVLETEKIEKPEFLKDLDNEEENMVIDKDYDFTNNVNTWTDFMYARYHPRTVHLVQEYEQFKNENSFDTFSNGSTIWKTENFEDNFGDKIRQYLEECNNCQGFQTLFDCTNGFSGLTLKCLQHLNDEYSKVNFAIPIIPPTVENFANSDGPMSDSIRLINIALTYSNLIENSDLFLPLSTMSKGWRSISNQRLFPLINYENSNAYQTSSILATYLDTISLQYRLKNPSSSNYLSSFCELNNYGRKMAAAGLALPFKMSPTEDLIDCLDKTDGSLFTQLSPNSEIGTDRICQNVCIRGIPKMRLKRPQKSAKAQMKMAAYRCDSVSEMFQLYFQCKNYQSLSNVSSIQSGMAIKTPYPTEIFHEQFNFEGFLSEFEIQEKQSKFS